MNQLDERTIGQHVTILGWLHIVGSGLALLIAAFTALFLIGIGAVAGEAEAMAVLTFIGTIVGAFIAVLALPGIVAGIGLLRRRGWGRILALIVGFLGLVNFPIGTAIGIYTFWVLLQDAASEYFS